MINPNHTGTPVTLTPNCDHCDLKCDRFPRSVTTVTKGKEN
jgi:hypothetical protein